MFCCCKAQSEAELEPTQSKVLYSYCPCWGQTVKPYHRALMEDGRLCQAGCAENEALPQDVHSKACVKLRNIENKL